MISQGVIERALFDLLSSEHTVLEMLHPLREAQRSGAEMTLQPYDFHLGPAGHAVAGRYLADFIMQLVQADETQAVANA